MNHAEIRESNDQYVSMWKVLSGDTPGADLNDRNGIDYCWADNAFLFWNALYVTEQIDDTDTLRARLRSAFSYMKTKKEGGLLYLCEDYLGDNVKTSLDLLVDEESFEFAIDIFGMVGDLLPLKAPAAHPDLVFERATTDQALAAYADINSLGYNMALDAGRAGLVGSSLWKEQAHAYIGYHQGQPVSTSATFVNAGQLYVALVATHPDFRNRGFGEATVRKSLEAGHAATGLRRTTLHATQAGYPVYERIGYHRVTRFMTYKPKAV